MPGLHGQALDGTIGGVLGDSVNLNVGSAFSVTGARSITGTIGGASVDLFVSSAVSETGGRSVAGTGPTSVAAIVASLFANGIFV